MAILSELALDSNGDLDLEGGRLRVIHGSDALAQRIATRLRTIKGEWVFDRNIGTPWFQSILGGKARARLGLIQQVIRQRIEDTQGVDRISSLRVQFDPNTRGLTVTGSVIAEGGDVISIAQGIGA